MHSTKQWVITLALISVIAAMPIATKAADTADAKTRPSSSQSAPAKDVRAQRQGQASNFGVLLDTGNDTGKGKQRPTDQTKK